MQITMKGMFACVLLQECPQGRTGIVSCDCLGRTKQLQHQNREPTSNSAALFNLEICKAFTISHLSVNETREAPWSTGASSLEHANNALECRHDTSWVLVFVKDARGCSKRQGIVLYAASMLGNPLPSATMMLATRKLARKRVQCRHLGGQICLLL